MQQKYKYATISATLLSENTSTQLNAINYTLVIKEHDCKVCPKPVLMIQKKNFMWTLKWAYKIFYTIYFIPSLNNSLFFKTQLHLKRSYF